MAKETLILFKNNNILEVGACLHYLYNQNHRYYNTSKTTVRYYGSSMTVVCIYERLRECGERESHHFTCREPSNQL
jgi:hypothetical protein